MPTAILLSLLYFGIRFHYAETVVREFSFVKYFHV